MRALRYLWRLLCAIGERWPAERLILIGDVLLYVPEPSQK